MIQLKGITKSFGDKIAVKNLSLHIQEGEVFGFLGPNGAGKTTTMKMILGLLTPTNGEILLFGKPAGSIDARKEIGFLPEMAHFYQHLTGREFLQFIGEIFNIEKKELDKRVKKLLKQVNLPTDAYDRPIGTYSKGMQQRIGMAQALINDPKILFLDEPMSGLDPIGRKEMKDIIVELKKAGKTIFFNSHILSDAESICDRVGIIHNGQLLVENTVKKLVSKTTTLEDVFIKTISGKKTAIRKKRTTKATPKKAEKKANTTKTKAVSSKKADTKKTKETPKKKNATAKKKITKKKADTKVIPGFSAKKNSSSSKKKNS